MKKPKFQKPAGMHDILPETQLCFQKIYRVVKEIARFYNFQKIDTPILEEAQLFSKGIGLGTDIVEKQMYTIRTKGGDLLALRPEGTASVVRAYIEHGMHTLPQPVKLWYFGPFFRYERPQAGRFRQFHQFGFEVLGERDPVIDAQIIQIFYNILKKLKFKNLTVEINSIGDSQCRPYFKKTLSSFLKYRQTQLCVDCRRRLKANPLRVFDCKEEKCQRVITQVPQMIDYLCEECNSHFKKVLEFLDEINIPYHLNPYLVRGLDYYTKTCFEIFEDTEQGRIQGALVGGGRYDSLVKVFGGKDTPACGGAAGIERMVNIMKTRAIRLPLPFGQTRIFLAQLGELAKRRSLKLIEEFRKVKIPIAESLGKHSLKSQLNKANKMGVDYTLILGQKEALEGTIIIREMRTGNQKTVKLEKVIEEIKKRIKK